jgi:hypothetical protein
MGNHTETVKATELRDGDLIRLSCDTYVKVASAEASHRSVMVTIYNGETPQDHPYKTFPRNADVRIRRLAA